MTEKCCHFCRSAYLGKEEKVAIPVTALSVKVKNGKAKLMAKKTKMAVRPLKCGLSGTITAEGLVCSFFKPNHEFRLIQMEEANLGRA